MISWMLYLITGNSLMVLLLLTENPIIDLTLLELIHLLLIIVEIKLVQVQLFLRQISARGKQSAELIFYTVS